MDMPRPGVIADFRSYRGQVFDEPFYWPFHLLALERELPEHVQEVIGQNSSVKPGLVRGEAPAPGPIQANRILPLGDSVFNFAASVVHINRFPARSLELVMMTASRWKPQSMSHYCPAAHHLFARARSIDPKPLK
jgi:hypothetical protein